MSAFRNLMKDSVSILKSDGRRFGPYEAAVTPNSIVIMERSLDVDEGDHIIRPIPSGKEEMYLVLSADFSQGLRTNPSCYILKVHKTTALSMSHPPRNTTINIHGSTGFQVGDHNTQNIQAAFTELIQRIEDSVAPPEQKADAKNRLAAFISHPLVTSVLGGAAGSLSALLTGS